MSTIVKNTKKVVNKKNKKRAAREKKIEKTVKTVDSTIDGRREKAKVVADKLLHATGSNGEDIRNTARAPKNSLKERMVLPSADPSLDVPVGIDARALQYLALGTVLRALRKGWLAGAIDPGIQPYYAFVYLYNAYASAVAGTIPALQSAPRYFWELCYALKPKTLRFKTGQLNYSPTVLDFLGEGVPPPRFVIGPATEQVVVYLGTPGGPKVNGFSTLLPPAAVYDPKLGADSIASLWETFSGVGMNKLIGDPGASGTTMDQDSSAFAAVYAELGTSYVAPGAMATTIQSERFITSPILSKFVKYQETDFFWRGWQEYRKSAGSATYIAPRCTELFSTRELHNKVSPVFLSYNFDEFVEVAALILIRAAEEATAITTLQPYPLTFQQFKILLRQTLTPYFSNDMAQDLRYSFLDSQNLVVTMLPLSVGPNGYSTTPATGGMRMPRFFSESLRCCKRLTSEIKAGIIDLIPILCRPPQFEMEGGYTWVPNGGAPADFFLPSTDILIDMIDGSTGATPDYVDFNGSALGKYITSHNNWITAISSNLTALTDLSTAEMGVSALNVNLCTTMLSYEFPQEVVSSTATVDNLMMAKGRSVRRTDPIVADKRYKRELVRRESRKADIGSVPPQTSVRAAPKPGSDYFLTSIGVREVDVMYNPLTTIWKYQGLMIKPTYFTVAQAFEAGSLIYKTFQIEPFKIPVGSVNEQFVVQNDTASLPALYDLHLSAANLDVKAKFTDTLSEVEVAFDQFQRDNEGGFFGAIGSIIGGIVDDLI